MRKFIIFLSMFILLFQTARAQSSMSDKQVFEYIVKQYEKGSSQGEIVTELMSKGVTLQQLQRVRTKYEKEYKTMDAVNAANMSSSTVSPTRARVSNSEDRAEMPSITNYVSSSADLLMLMQLSQKEEQDNNIFGHDIFRAGDISFEPNMNIATPDDYLLGAGDVIFIDIYGASQQTIEVGITPDGFVSIEDFGLIPLSGLTISQATKRLNKELGSRYENSKIKVTLGQTRTIKVNVMGEVTTPGTYTLSAFSTVFHALYVAGGVNPIGTLRDIKVFRNNRQITSVDVYDYIINGNLAGNVRLADDDVIIVGPYCSLVSIEGKIRRPMQYEMKKNESLAQLIEYAGGFTGDAYTKTMRVKRSTGQSLSIHTVDAADFGTFIMADQDYIAVDSILHRYSNAVELKGAVFRPGFYELNEKIRTVKNLIDYAEGVTEEAFLAHAVLHRMKEDRTQEVLQIDLGGILNGTSNDILLKNEDILMIPSWFNIRQGQKLTIHGEVFKPGVFNYAENTTIEDLILQAGGLKESASSIKVDVARRIIDQKATKDSEMRSQTFTFELKDGFVVDAEPGFALQPNDEVYVRRSPGYSIQENVSVTGEVLFAGTYTLAKQNFRLSDVIAMAGGTTSMANVKGARLERKVTAEEKLRMQQAIKMAKVKDNSLDTTNIRNIAVQESYFVGIDLEKAIKNPGGDEDIVLHQGDKIIVPRLINTVKINGEVMYPNTVGYISGKRASYYIAQAGGYSNNAKRRRAYIIYQNGKVAKLRRHAKPAPGCEIVVPAKPQKNNMTLATQWISISTSVATVAALLINAFK